MNLFFRLLKLLIGFAFARPKMGVMDMSRLRFQVWISDHDMFGHMNNSRYVSLMDLGMIDIFLRGRMLNDLRREGLRTLIMGKRIAFYKPLSFPTRYILQSRIACWSDYHIVFEHDFMVGDTVHARGHSIGRLAGAKGDRPTVAEVITRCGWDVPLESPEPTGNQRSILMRAEAEKENRGPMDRSIYDQTPAH